jgi:hypothetical protein
VVGTNTDDVVWGKEEELVEVSGKSTVVLVVVDVDEVEVSGTVVVVRTVAGTVVSGTVVVVVVVDVVDVVVNSHRDRLLIVRWPGWQHVSIEYCRKEKMSPSSTGTEREPEALFC